MKTQIIDNIMEFLCITMAVTIVALAIGGMIFVTYY